MAFLMHLLVLFIALFSENSEPYVYRVYVLSSFAMVIVVLLGFWRVLRSLLPLMRLMLAIPLTILVSLLIPMLYADAVTNLLNQSMPFDRQHLAYSALHFLAWCLLLVSFQPWLVERIALYFTKRVKTNSIC